MAAKRQLLKIAATYAGYVLAIVGALQLFALPVHVIASHVGLTDAAALARTFCERYVFPGPDSTRPQSAGQWRLVGITLLATSNLDAARFHVRGLTSVLSWHFDTDAFSAAEQGRILGGLPSGILRAPVVSDPLPSMRPGTRATLSAIALVESDDDCSSADSLTVSAGNGKVYIADSHVAVIRGATFSPWTLIVALVGAPLIAWALGRWQRRSPRDA